MPCPFFEPQHVARQPKHPKARLPLLDEYHGVCHANEDVVEIPETARFRFCNHGYSQGECGHRPKPDAASCLRFELLGRSSGYLELLYLEEQNHVPVRWQKVIFRITESALEPEPEDVCARAQMQAFCKSYLARFPE